MTKFSKGDKIVFNQSVFSDGRLNTTGLIGEITEAGEKGRFVAIGKEWEHNEGAELFYHEDWIDVEISNQLNNKQ